MTKSFKNILTSLLAVAILSAAASVRAADKKADKKTDSTSTNAPAASAKKSLPYGGTLTAVDAAAKTVTIKKKDAEKTFTITSATKISSYKTGKPAELADGVIGEPASVSYKTGDDGKDTALSLHFGSKPKKTDSTNAPTAAAPEENPAKSDKK